MTNRETAEFLRTQANELWLPILALEDLRELKVAGHNSLIQPLLDLYTTQRRLEEKAKELEK
jgi:hypothetical protein